MANGFDFEEQYGDGRTENTFSWSGKFKISKRGCITLVLLGFLFVGGCYGCNRGMSYVVWSEGYRDGHVIKFSYKGFPVKHYEGNLNMGALGRNNNAAGDNSMIWHFSVTDPEVVKQLEAIDSEVPVRLHYTEYWKPGMWNDTPYYVNRVERLDRRR